MTSGGMGSFYYKWGGGGARGEGGGFIMEIGEPGLRGLVL